MPLRILTMRMMVSRVSILVLSTLRAVDARRVNRAAVVSHNYNATVRGPNGTAEGLNSRNGR